MDTVSDERSSARYFDGLSAMSHAAEAWVAPDGIHIARSDGEPRHWPFAELVIMRAAGRGQPLQLERKSVPVEVLIVSDEAFQRRLRAAVPAGARLERGGGWTPDGRLVLALVAAGVLLLFALYRFGIPALADVAAAHIPVEWERKFGETMVEEAVPPDDRVDEPVIVGPVRAIHQALVRDAGGPAGETRLLVLRSDVPNAFTFPGGVIVVTTGLLTALRTPDELAAVIAHEVGHVQRRHVMRSVLRQLSLQVLLALVAGDQSVLSSGLRTAGQLGGLSYSRADEREADDEAVGILARESVSPVALADALTDIERAADPGATLGFLSTHPAPAERRAHILKRSALGTHADARPGGVTGSDWRLLKGALRVMRALRPEAPPAK